MARLLSTALVLALLAASAVAFAVTESAKLSLSPIAGTDVTKVFSPKGRYPRAHVKFRLRTRERISAWIEDGHGNAVKTLRSARTYPRGTHLDLVWRGRDEAGALVPDGTYQPVVKLELSHRTIKLPNPIVVDTRPPQITVPRDLRATISPDGDGRHDAFHIAYRVDEPAHGILRVLPPAAQHATRVEFTRFARLHDSLVWNGKLAGVPVKPGVYRLYVTAEDVAGNDARPYLFAEVRVRYVVLDRTRIVVKRRARFAVRVSTDAPRVEVRFAGASSRRPRGTLPLRAPKTPGVYHLYVEAAGHAAGATVIVR